MSLTQIQIHVYPARGRFLRNRLMVCTLKALIYEKENNTQLPNFDIQPKTKDIMWPRGRPTNSTVSLLQRFIDLG